jgi:hypothetical protein
MIKSNDIFDMENNSSNVLFMPSPIHHSTPNHVVDYSEYVLPQDLTQENELEEYINRIVLLEKEIEECNVQIKKLQSSSELPTDEFVSMCKAKAGNSSGRFVRNLLIHFYPQSMFKELSLSGKHGKIKLSQYIFDFILKQCMKMYPKLNVKLVRKICVNIFVHERLK